MSAFDDAVNVINMVSSGPNQATSDHGQLAVALSLLAIAEAVNGLKPDPAEWKADRWWRTVGPDGSVWCESSNEAEVRERARPGDTIQRFYITVPSGEWRNA